MVDKVASKRIVGVVIILTFGAAAIWLATNRRPEEPADGKSNLPVAGLPPDADLAAGGPATPPEPRAPKPSEPQAEPGVTEIPPIRAGQFQNTDTAAEYVGNDACAECHIDQHQSYLHTVHSRSLREVDPGQEPPDHQLNDPVSRRSYELYRQDDQYRHREVLRFGDNQQLELADYACRYVVGSGAHALTYLVDAGDGFLAESPVTWYASLQDWALSPGFENYNTGFARPVYADCLFCHTGRSEPIDGNRGRIQIHTNSIDCERCHGPGSLHVAKQEVAADARSAAGHDLTIVNPRHLARSQSEAICAQCHLDSAAETDVRGRHLRDFRPGHWLEDYRVYYGLQVPDASMKVVGHVEQLHLSSCYRGTETLTCTTCHDPHSTPAAEERIDFYREKCITCHLEQPCSLPETTRLAESPEDNCLACHMPPSSTDIVHVPATHHRIGIHADTVADGKSPSAGELIPLGDISHLPKLEQDRCLGLGYLDASIVTREPQVSEAYRVRARDMLEDVTRRGLKDPVVAAALAKIYQRENPPQSIVHAESALQSPNLTVDTRTQALFSLSNAYLSLQQTQLAIQPLEQLVKLRRQAGDWFLLGVCRMRAGDLEAALEAAQRAAMIRPDKSNFQALLAELYRQSGQTELAQQHEARAQQLAGPPPETP